MKLETYCNNKAHWVTIGGISVLFSYETAIALRANELSCRLDNSWGPTTGKHFNQCGAGCLPIVSDEEFDRRVKQALFEQAMEQNVHSVLRS